jgi:Spy/CpxP family protein refolding chaperone
MTKLIALVAAGMLATGAVFAGAHGDCAKKVGNKDKAACQVNLASLNLTAEQKTKMETAMKDHEKAGCNEASEAKYEQEAQSILNKDQFAKFKAQEKSEHEKTQS